VWHHQLFHWGYCTIRDLLMNQTPEDVTEVKSRQYSADNVCMVAPATEPLTGVIVPPSDKSITHRALFLGAISTATTIIINPASGADPRSTLGLIRSVGCDVHEDDHRWTIHRERTSNPSGDLVLDCENSGTTVRLAAGFLTGERGNFTLTGDASLSRRPMERIAEPLRLMGASVATTDGHLPMVVRSEQQIVGCEADQALEVSSAQVHAALVLAGLRSRDGVTLRRAVPMRDHTLRMVKHFGIEVETERVFGAWYDVIHPATPAQDVEVIVPGDFSSAAFFIAAALLVRGSELELHNVGLNPTRIALLQAMVAMGGRIDILPMEPGFEPFGKIRVHHTGDLRGMEFTPGFGEGDINVAEMMDELPLLALVASQAHGTTTVHGASELRVKESDRIAATVEVLGALGVAVIPFDDGFSITGPQRIRGGATINHHGDHRICMMAAIGALIAEQPVVIPAPRVASVSYPDFWSDLDRVAGGVVHRHHTEG
jgi:3-phosphoshikimate 1-carboxyvinyltransferase